MLGLGFGYEDKFGIKAGQGDILVGDLSRLPSPRPNSEIPLIEKQSIVHLYSLSGDPTFGALERKDEVLQEVGELGKRHPEIFSSWENGTAGYHFRNFDPDNFNIFLPSNRYVETAAQCNEVEIINDPQSPPDVITVNLDGSFEKLPLPAPDLGETIIFTDPRNECGSRCSVVSVYQPFITEEKPPLLLNCSVEVSEVENASHDFEEVSDELAQLAAGAIALDGLERGDNQVQYNVWPLL